MLCIIAIQQKYHTDELCIIAIQQKYHTDVLCIIAIQHKYHTDELCRKRFCDRKRFVCLLSSGIVQINAFILVASSDLQVEQCTTVFGLHSGLGN